MKVMASEVLHVHYREGGPPTATTRMGGAPSSWSISAAAEWPKCERCARPLRFVGQIVGPFTLANVALDAHEAVQIFACLDESSQCPSWAAFVRMVDDRPAKSVAAPFAAFAMSTSPGHDDEHDKLGGTARATPATCAKCNHPMELLAQLASDAVPSPFADGTMFVHICPKKHRAAIQYVR
jgi:hypothetical protein